MDIDPLHLVQTFSDAGEIHKKQCPFKVFGHQIL